MVFKKLTNGFFSKEEKQMMKLKTVAIAAGIVCSMAFSTQVLAVGGASGPHVAYPSKGKIGEIVVNPYGIAPLTESFATGAT